MAYQTFNFDYEEAYTSSIVFKTNVDDTESGNEQRRDMWAVPKRKWRLEFNKMSPDRENIVNFFIARKGKKEAFYWQWKETDPLLNNIAVGGDGNTYLVRFDTDELSFDHIAMGFNNFYIDLIQVFN